jgi:hypothetical protein
MDLWQHYGGQAGRPFSLFPEYFRIGLDARGLAAADQWARAVGQYRRMFRATAVGGVRQQMRGVREDYASALVSEYSSRRAVLTNQERLRWALWLWRTGDWRAGRHIIAQLLDSCSSDRLRGRYRAYMRLLSATGLRTLGKENEAAAVLAEIPLSERAVYLRGILQSAIQEDQDLGRSAPADWQKALQNWQPSIQLEKSGRSGDARLAGAEVLEPELIPDGGDVCVALFWEDVPDSLEDLGGPGLYRVGGGKIVQVVWSRNLVQDPGFEWPRSGKPEFDLGNQERESGISDWYKDGYGGGGNLPIREVGYPGGVASFIIRLENFKDGPRSSGIAQFVGRVDANDRLLVAGRFFRSEGEGICLLGYWHWFREGQLFYTPVLQPNKEWAWIGGMVVPPADTQGVELYATNYGTTGEVLLDDLIMFRVVLPF